MAPVLRLDAPTRRRANEESAPLGPRSEPPSQRRRSRPKGLSSAHLETFTRDLETQLKAGIPLLRALEVETHRDGDREIVDVASFLADRLRAGSAFSAALAELPDSFPSVYRSIVRAGELSGRLDELLGDLGSYLRWRGEVNKTVKKALRYPVIVIVLTFVVVLFILGFVFPKFDSLFAKFGDDLPAVTASLMAAGKFVEANWVLCAGGFVALMFTCFLVAGTRTGRRLIFGVLGRVPLFGDVLHSIDLARWTRTMAVLEGAGIPIVDSLEISADAVASPELQREIDEVREDLIGGERLSSALAASPAVPRLVADLAAVGEESGSMEESFRRLAEHYDEDARDRVDRAIALFEPLTTVFLGLIVGGMAAVIISTLYKAMVMVGR